MPPAMSSSVIAVTTTTAARISEGSESLVPHDEHGDAVDACDERQHGGREQEDQLQRGALGPALVVEEVHDRRLTQNCTLGASRISGCSGGISSSAAAVKLNMPA